jgi:hypothetical protein
MVALPYAIAVAVIAFALCCTAVLFRYRRGRLAADAMHLLEAAPPALELRPVLAFEPLLCEAPQGRELARVSGLTLIEAEDLLDWLEQNGYEQRGLLCESDSTFTVEFRIDPRHATAPPPHQVKSRRTSAG